ncbi:hypothetical protein [Verrucomicrobium spinosum]|uniref:hypothetical protein n=1 Tax=Verrucomicrobium spinosum TaxID=2736 RepID=UPI00017460EE|nr:hypothetical protein [Verrucomicrobium spinosum]
METEPKFEMGGLSLTPGALNLLDPEEVLNSLNRHQRGDWGDCDHEDAQANDLALVEGTRVFSVYHDRRDQKFWIITEADRSMTTVILPEEY